MHTTLGTYYRAFDHNASPAAAAGHYNNTVATLIAKGVVGFLTAGIGLGIIWLIEHYGNVVPKIKEFARNSKLIYKAIQSERHSNVIFVELEGGRKLHLEQLARDTGDGVAYSVKLVMGNESMLLQGATFDSILRSIRTDYVRRPDLYDYVFGPVAERVSSLINIEDGHIPAADIESGQIPATGLVSVVEKIENELFWHSIPNNKLELLSLLTRAFWRVTGVQLNDEIEVAIPAEKARGLDSTTVSPTVFNHKFNRIVASSQLPDRPKKNLQNSQSLRIRM